MESVFEFANLYGFAVVFVGGCVLVAIVSGVSDLGDAAWFRRHAEQKPKGDYDFVYGDGPFEFGDGPKKHEF